MTPSSGPPFSRYFKRRGDIEDVSEYLRSLASLCRNEIFKRVVNREITDRCSLLFQEMREKVREYATVSNELSLKVWYCCEGFVKRPGQMHKTYHSRHREPDNEPRSSNILGALRWALEKYIILKLASTYFVSQINLLKFIALWLDYRYKSPERLKECLMEYLKLYDKLWDDIERSRGVFSEFYPPNLVFGRGGRASSIWVREVGGSRDSGLCTVRLSLSIEPPPAVYMAFRRLGVPARDVERVIASFLAVAVALLNPSSVYGGEAPVPLTRDLHESTTQRAVIETPYEVDIDLVDYVIENFWCKVVNNA